MCPRPCTRLELSWGGGACPVLIGPGALEQLDGLWRPSWRQAALIGDAQVMELYGDAVARRLAPLVDLLELQSFPPGEASKTRATKAALEDHLLTRGFTRQTCVVALGGGISLDLAGFVAATYMRGVPTVNIPTSLLAQVDAAVGGKTGLNTPLGKNLIGAFHHPSAVLIDGELLATLPQEQWRCGLAEAVKSAFIADPDLFGWLEQNAAALQRPGSVDPHLITRCVEIKAAIVQSDERETGRRRVLNFGHTVGHALEMALHHQISHGEAVALGMAVEVRLARALCGCPEEDQRRLTRLLVELGLDLRLPDLHLDQLSPFLDLDKKRTGSAMIMALPRCLGNMAEGSGDYAVEVTLQQLKAAWEELP